MSMGHLFSMAMLNNQTIYIYIYSQHYTTHIIYNQHIYIIIKIETYIYWNIQWNLANIILKYIANIIYDSQLRGPPTPISSQHYIYIYILYYT